MRTFVTNPRMDAALAARIERSLGAARRRAAASHYGSSRSSRVAVVPIIALVTVIALFLVARWQSKRELEQSRSELLHAVRTEQATLTRADEGFLQTIEPWILRFASPYEGEVVVPELRSDPKALQAVLAHAGLYSRNAIADLANAARLAQAASGSIKDAFLLCLFDPPEDRSEKALLARVRGVNFGGAIVEQRTANIHRLHDAEAGLRVLLPAWSDRVLAAQDPKELLRLKTEFLHAPVQEAKRATKADLLIVVVDEPGDTPGSATDTELAHDVRVGLVDLRADKVLLRIRRRSDPSVLSAATRSIHARAVDGCALAWDVHQAAHP